MASSFVPAENTRNGFTIMTQVVPGGTEQYGLQTGGGISTGGPVKKLLKGEPKALGTVQIMIGIMTLSFGIIKTVRNPDIGVYIASGSLSIAASNKADACVVRGSLVMNIISAVAAGAAIVLLSFDMHFFLIRAYYRCSYGSYEPRDLCEAATWMMASSFVPAENTRNGFTIMTQVVAKGTEQYGLRTGGGISTGGPVKKLLKGEPKALGTVQIMIGIMTLSFGIIKTVYGPSVGVFSGVTYWGSCIYIISGSLSIAASNKGDACVVRGSLVMNIISAVAAVAAIVLLSFDMDVLLTRAYYSCSYGYSYRCEDAIWMWKQSAGISGVLLGFSVFEFIVSIFTSVFACKVTCCAESPTIIYLNKPETDNLAIDV
ncbi:hypothetical protein MHYP_G00355400 [Metynnis hypsauchen]